VVFISHRLREVRSFCDSLTILRNGQHIASGKVAELSDEEVVRMIVGRSLGQAFPAAPRASATAGPGSPPAEKLTTGGKLADASLTLHRGEILGVAGLQGMASSISFWPCFGMGVARRRPAACSSTASRW